MDARRTAPFRSARLRFDPFGMDDAPEVYACISPEVSRFMRWDPPASYESFRSRRLAALQADDGSERSFVIRRADTLDCLGMAAVDGARAPVPEVGLWLRADAHGPCYGTETVAALLAWAAANLGRGAFDYPVAVDNAASRRIAERLGGTVVARRSTAKYEAVVYRIAAIRAGDAPHATAS